jgi:SAM-dependent methyltransferase
MVTLINPVSKNPLKRVADSLQEDDGTSFPIINGIPRFVDDHNYTDNFGFQWNKFQKTQIDREIKNSSFSKERFFAATNWDKEDLSGKDVLEVGSGAGRFSQIVLDSTKANLYSLDYSDAVSANYKNNAHHGDRLKLFQASIYDMPFPDNSFDKVFCFGVLQHTPDFRKSIQCLVDKAKPGGEIVVDFYPIKGWYTKISAKYILRPFTRKMSHEKLLGKIERNADRLMKTYYFFDKLGMAMVAHRFIPMADIKRTMPDGLSKETLREWVILDTFDMFSPAYDNPQRINTVKKWMQESGAEVTFAGFLTYANNLKLAAVRGIKKG